MSFRYAIWFGVRPCRSARRVRSARRAVVVRRRAPASRLRARSRSGRAGCRRPTAASRARGVEALQRLGRARRLRRRRRATRERAAAMRDRDVERRLDLAQVGVERPAQVGERAVVERRERELDGCSCFRRDGCSPAAGRPDASDALPHHRRLQRLVERARALSREVRARLRRRCRPALRGGESRRAAASPRRAAARARRPASTATAAISASATRRTCSRCRLRRDAAGSSWPVFSSLQIDAVQRCVELGQPAAPAGWLDLDLGVEQALRRPRRSAAGPSTPACSASTRARQAEVGVDAAAEPSRPMSR